MNKYQIVFVDVTGKMVYKAYNSEAEMVNSFIIAEKMFMDGKVNIKPIHTRHYGN